jgi:hypothetical protein
MEKLPETKSVIEQAAQDLFNFAVDREDTKLLMASLHEAADIKRNTVEYELQILKIISVGWAISYYLENYPQKNLIGASYWQAIHDFSQNLSETFGLFVSQSIDYFQILKDRLETYVNALHQKPGAPEPAVVIGPEFADLCGNRNDVFTALTGSKMFVSTIGSVKQYIESLGVKQAM